MTPPYSNPRPFRPKHGYQPKYGWSEYLRTPLMPRRTYSSWPKSGTATRFAFLFLCAGAGVRAWAVDPPTMADTNAAPRFKVQGYMVNDATRGSSTNLVPMLSAYTGESVGLEEIVHAASDLQAEYARRGLTNASVAIGPHEITNGIVTMHLFQSAIPQIRIAGKRYEYSENAVALISDRAKPAGTNAVAATAPAPEEPLKPVKPLSPEEKAMRQKMAELDLAERLSRLPPAPPLTTQHVIAPEPTPVSTNLLVVLRAKEAEQSKMDRRALLLPPRTNAVPVVVSTNNPTFEVKGYDLIGNTVLPADITELVLQPYLGDHITFDNIRSALTDLQTVYRAYGYATVSVTLPQQTLSDHVIKIRVFEGRLAEIALVNNHYFSSNNIMRTLPSLHPNMILTAPVFQAELDRANANQDRQIYPSIEPGFVEGTSTLKLDVKDRLPLHGKLEINNQNSPGTPDLRINASAEYRNLWQLEHSLGVQYSFSPESFKNGQSWDLYDKPLVANYSAFYRMPLNTEDGVESQMSSGVGAFGYDEATRKFNLPPPSGRLELNVFASRSTIDTGVTQLGPTKDVLNVPGVISITEKDNQQDLTVNNDIGARLSIPRSTTPEYQSTLSTGFDFKTYDLTSFKTNNFLFSIVTRDPGGNINPPVISTVASPNPPPKGQTIRHVEYFPISLRYDAMSHNSFGVTTLGFGASGNVWFSGSVKELQAITGSSRSQGHWIVLTPSVAHDFMIRTNWTLSLRADAQFASEPLISNEQFGSGGVNNVRGYPEGAVFGDSGFHSSIELKTPPHVVGLAYGKQALVVRGSVFMDYAEADLIDPQGRPAEVPLWGCGFGGVISVGTHWDGRFVFAWPLLSTLNTPAAQPRFNFSLTGQF